MKPKAVEPAQPTFTGEFNLLRLFGISSRTSQYQGVFENYKAGTIVVHTHERRLYLVLAMARRCVTALAWGVTDLPGEGCKLVSAKREWPSWTPPPEMSETSP